MPKAKTRNISSKNSKYSSKNNSSTGGATRMCASNVPLSQPRSTAAVEPGRRSQVRNVGRQGAERQGRQNLFMAAMVALGCWGFAFTFAFFTNDPNRYLFSGMAVIMAMMWSALFGVRLRKILQGRSSQIN